MDLSLVFDGLELSGFMSFPPNKVQKLNLNTKRLTAIIGENLDKGDGERNGVGKSAIIDAILYLYFGKTPRMANQDLPNKFDTGPLFVTGAASRSGIAFRVERGEHPSVLRLFEKSSNDSRDFRHKENGKLIFETTKSTKPETTKRIVDLLGFDLKLADVLLLNTPSDKSCFFLKSEEEQRSIVERIFGFTIFTEKADRVRELRKEENKNLTTKVSALIATKQANDRVLARIASLEEKSNEWATERDKLAKFLTQQINTYRGINFDHELDQLEQAEKLHQQAQQIEREVKTHKEALRVLEAKHTAWDTGRGREMTSLSQTIQTLRKVDAAAEIERIKLKLQIEQDTHNVMAELQAAQRERDPNHDSIESAAIQKSRLGKQANALEQQIIQLHDSKCPTCGQNWADTRDHILKSIDELDQTNEEIGKLNTQMDDLRKKVKAIDFKMDKLKMQINGLTAKLDKLPETTYKTIEEATRASAGLGEQITKLEALKETENPHAELMVQTADRVVELQAQAETFYQRIKALPGTRFAQLVEAQEAERNLTTLNQQWDELQSSENPYRETIDQLRNETLQPIDEREIKAIERKIEHMTLLISLLADRDSPIRKAVLNEWLPELNHRVNNYLTSQEVDHRVEFDPNMTVTFTKDTKTLGFGNLSTGQRLRVWLATNRAFREIFELINYPISLFFVDELLDKGLSARGAEVAYQLLEEMVQQGKSIFLMTHRSELVDMADNTLTVQLESGMSTIIEAS